MEEIESIIVTSSTEVEDSESDPVQIGNWFWIKESESEWFGCITHIGNNFAKLQSPTSSIRVHFDEWNNVCRLEKHPQRVINGRVEKYKRKIAGLMEEVKLLTQRLAIAPNPALTSGPEGGETQALAVRLNSKSYSDYSTDLVKAKDETLPELFNKIKKTTEKLTHWMSANIIPLEAQTGGLDALKEQISNRIFNVELYAGLIEQIEQVHDGKPAEIGTKLHLMQRLCFMDEECLAQYETGGMDFKSIGHFDKWLCRPDNLNRLLPFDRCVTSFRVRRHKKDRDHFGDIKAFFRILEEEKIDEFTFLYIRNGEQVFRLRTGVEFGYKFFPDMSEYDATSGKPMVAIFDSRSFQSLITEDNYNAQLKEHEENQRLKKIEYESTPSEDRWRFHGMNDPLGGHFTRYIPFRKSEVYYDDICHAIQEEIQAQNRVTLVIQGLLDRSPCFHPHPPWQIYTEAGFKAALELVYDSDRALAAGPKPDFEAYRARLNASVGPGSIVIGQQRSWLHWEAVKENNRPKNYNKYHELSSYHPHGNPGPGKVSYVIKSKYKLDKKKIKCKYAFFQWIKTKTYWKTIDKWNDKRELTEKRILCKFHCKIEKLFNISDYKPGDFKQFFNDPRTREEYLKWAYFLLNAEEYHAGNVSVEDCVTVESSSKKKYKKKPREVETIE